MTLPIDENGSFSLATSYAGNTGRLAYARRDLVDFLRGHQLRSADLERVSLVLTELATNAVEASPGKDFRVRVELAGRTVRIEVSNDAPGELVPPRQQWQPSSLLSPRGRGLMIVEAVADRLTVSSTEASVVVAAELDLPEG